jgi:hypothetical protein
MAHDTAAPPTPAETSLAFSTRRGIAAVSVGIGFWASLVFWWYPYSPFIATIGLSLALFCRFTGVRAHGHGANLPQVGIALNLIAIGAAMTVYRVMQVYFEGQPAVMPLTGWSI